MMSKPKSMLPFRLLASLVWCPVGGREVIRRTFEIGLLLTALALWAATMPVPEPVFVFPIKMDADCVHDAHVVLEREGVPHRVCPTEDGIVVRPDDRPRAQVALVLAGLPRHRMPIRDDWGCDGGPSEALLRKRAQRAEVMIGQAMAVFPGVQCARVKIRRGAEMAFAADQKPNRLQVWLKLGAPLPPAHSAAIGRLALVGYYDIRCPIEVEIRDRANDRLLGSAQLGYSTGPHQKWETF